jgi:hypothetical protein
MLVFVRFPPDSGVELAEIEDAALGAVGHAGAVLGASSTSLDLEISDDAVELLAALAADLRGLGMPPSTVIDLPRSGQRFSIYDF